MTPDDIEKINRIDGPLHLSNAETKPYSPGRPLTQSTLDIVEAAQRAARRVQYLAYLFAGAGILFGIILIAQKDEYNETNPYIAQGVGVAINAVVLSIILYAIGKYMEARLVQGSDSSSQVERK